MASVAIVTKLKIRHFFLQEQKIKNLSSKFKSKKLRTMSASAWTNNNLIKNMGQIKKISFCDKVSYCNNQIFVKWWGHGWWNALFLF